MTRTEIKKATRGIQATWHSPGEHIKGDAEIAAAWLRKARRDVVAMIATYNQLMREVERVRELLHWTTNPDAEVSFWHVCDAAVVDPRDTRAMLVKGIESSLLMVIKG